MNKQTSIKVTAAKELMDEKKKQLGEQLISAIKKQDIDLVSKSIRDGADVNFDEGRPIQECIGDKKITEKKLLICKLLIEKGADKELAYSKRFCKNMVDSSIVSSFLGKVREMMDKNSEAVKK